MRYKEKGIELFSCSSFINVSWQISNGEFQTSVPLFCFVGWHPKANEKKQPALDKDRSTNTLTLSGCIKASANQGLLRFIVFDGKWTKKVRGVMWQTFSLGAALKAFRSFKTQKHQGFSKILYDIKSRHSKKYLIFTLGLSCSRTNAW